MQPTTLDFGDVYLGDAHTIDLSVLTLDGEPLKDPKFELRIGDATPSFTLLQGGPLGTSWALVFRPRSGFGVFQRLRVTTDGKTFELQAYGRGMPVPRCPNSTPGSCLRTTFSFTEEKCVDVPMEDGEQCSPADCEGDYVCDAGACKYVVRENTPPVCQQDVPLVTLQPAWTYEADADREVVFSGIVDADDNLYVYDCRTGEANKGRCDVVSLTADGQRRWRIPESVLPKFSAFPQVSVIGGILFVSDSTDGSFATLAFRLTDGSLAWQQEGISAPVPAGAGRVAAVLQNKDAMLNGAVLVFDLETGAELSRQSDVIPGTTAQMVVSDGQGMLYTDSSRTTDSAGNISGVVSAVSLERGRLWRVDRKDESGLWGTDGTRLFSVGEDVLATEDGRVLYTDPGLKGPVMINSTQQAIFTITPGPEMAHECRETNLRRLRLSDGVEQSSCRTREGNASIESLIFLLPTRDGGTVFLAGSARAFVDPTEKVYLRRTDADGNAIFRGQLEGVVHTWPDLTFFPMTAIVKGRFVTPGQVPGGRTSVVAYDVPGLELAEHGWISLGGSQARNYAPW